MRLTAVLASVAALLLVWRPRPHVRPPGSRWPAMLVLAAPVGAVAALVPSHPLLPALGVVLAATVSALGALWRRARWRRQAASTEERVVEVCELLASELASGRPVGAALERAAADWPPLAAAAEAHALGSDVPAAIRQVAGVPGAQDLRLVGAAWQVAHRSGHGLAGAVSRTAEELRAAQATRRVVDAELASARATARLVAGLPLPVLLLGSGAGGHPWRFLVGTPAGLGCLALGLGLVVAGLWWIEVLAADVVRSSR